jgi:hypothetical protein
MNSGKVGVGLLWIFLTFATFYKGDREIGFWWALLSVTIVGYALGKAQGRSEGYDAGHKDGMKQVMDSPIYRYGLGEWKPGDRVEPSTGF